MPGAIWKMAIVKGKLLTRDNSAGANLPEGIYLILQKRTSGKFE